MRGLNRDRMNHRRMNGFLGSKPWSVNTGSNGKRRGQSNGPKKYSQPVTPQRPPLKQQNDDDSEFDEKTHKRIPYTVKAQGNTFTQYYVGDPVEDFKLLDWK